MALAAMHSHYWAGPAGTPPAVDTYMNWMVAGAGWSDSFATAVSFAFDPRILDVFNTFGGQVKPVPIESGD